MFEVPNQYQVRNSGSPLDSSDEYGNNGAFIIPFESYELHAIASDGGGWEHVSVLLRNRTPNWREMCFIKDLFWDDEDCVIQYHPPKSEYVNNHDFTLHLWRQVGREFPRPPSLFVGLK
jgi:hypothetical protein